MERVDTADNKADLFTKHLPRPAFEKHKRAIGIVGTREWLHYERPYADIDMLSMGPSPGNKIVSMVAAVTKRALQWLNRVAGSHSEEEKVEIMRNLVAALCSKRAAVAATAVAVAGTAANNPPFLPGKLEITHTAAGSEKGGAVASSAEYADYDN